MRPLPNPITSPVAETATAAAATTATPGHRPRGAGRGRRPCRLLEEQGRDLVYRYRLLPTPGFEYVSPSATELCGYSPQDHYADPRLAFRHVHPDDLPLLEQVARGEAPDPVVLRWIRRDGSVIWTEQRNTPVRDQAGRLVAIEGSARDVTVRERAHEALELSERRLRALLDRAEVPAAATSLDGTIVYLSTSMGRLTGWEPAEAVGRDWFDTFVPEAARGQRRAAFLDAVRDGQVDRDLVLPVLRRDGAERLVEMHLTGIPDSGGRLASVAFVMRDLSGETERVTLAARLTAAIEQVADAVVITDAEARIEYVNPAFERVSGYGRREVAGRNPRLLKSGRQPASFYRHMWRRLASGESWHGEFVNRRKDGQLFVEEATITPIRDEAGRITSYVGVKRDVTGERALRDALDRVHQQREEAVRSIAALTPGPTLEATAERIATSAATLAGAPSAAVIAFENGRQARLLASVTELDLPLRPGDPLPPSRAAYLRDRAVQGPWVERWVARDEDGEYAQRITRAGISASLYVPIGEPDDLLALLTVSSIHADGASALAEILPSVVEIAAVARGMLAPLARAQSALRESRERIAKVIEEQAFEPVFQPVVDLATLAPVGFEALTRFRTGIRPDLVFSEARHAGMGVELEAATLAAAVRQASALPAGAWLSLNVSPRLLLDGDRLHRLLADRRRPIVLEVTEHEAIDDYPALRKAVEALGDGVWVAVDDTGAGVANLTHLAELRPTFVKLDIGLVRGVHADLGRQGVVAGIRHYARATGGTVIAEGVERQADLATMRSLGVQLGQGFLFGRPMPIDAWLRRTGTRSSSASA